MTFAYKEMHSKSYWSVPQRKMINQKIELQKKNYAHEMKQEQRKGLWYLKKFRPRHKTYIILVFQR